MENALWPWVRLRDLLKKAGLKLGVRRIRFDGLD